MANFALNYSFSRNLPIPLDEDAVKATLAEVVDYVKTKGKCYEGQLFSVTGETESNVIKNGLYIALSKGENGKVIKLASQEALDAVAASAGKIDKIQLNGTELTINDKVVNIDLSDYATTAYVDDEISKLSDVYAPKSEFEEVQKKVEDITSTGGEPNVQSDWNTVDETLDSFIKNKPDLTVYATKDELSGVTSDINETINGLADVYASKTVVETLVGSDVNKSARGIAAEEVAKVVADANADFDTLKEISDWILNDTTGAAHMANDIKALKQEDIAIDGRLDVLEGVKHSHTNKEVLDGITETKVSSWDAAEQNAKNYADSLASNYDVAGAAASAETAAKAYADGLASNYDVAGAAASAETAAKAYADGLYNTATAYTDTKVSEANSAATVYTNTKISEANTYAENKALEALNNAKTYAEGLGIKYDSVGSASGALATAKLYADGLKTEAINTAADDATTKVNDAKTEINSTIDAVSGAAKTLVSDLAFVVAGNKTDAETYANSVAKTAREIAEANASAYTNAEIAKLTNVYAPKAEFEEVQKKVDEITSTGGEPNVQSDWNTVDTESDSFIKNKPDLSVYATKNELTGATSDINEAIIKSYTSATTYFESEINSLSNVYAPKTVVETLVGDDADKSVRNIATEEVAKVVAEAPEAFDTLKEIAEWIGNGSGTTAADIVTDIAALQAADELFDGRLNALEVISGQSHIHLNKDVLDDITEAKVSSWDAAEQNAKNYADGLASNYDVAGAAASAETAAKAYADGLVENIKPYEGGVAASITMGEEDNYVVDVKVAADADDKKNFLDINTSNELEVTGITLDAAKTSKDIVVEGGAWADSVKQIFGGTVPAGTTWEAFLEKMLCVEKYAGTITTSSAFTVSLSSALNPGFNKSGTVEVGTKATLSKVTGLSTTASQSLTAKTFTYGYKLGEDGAYKSASAYTETLTPSLKTSSKALKVTFSGVKDAVNSGNSLSTIEAEGEIAAKEMYIMEGENKVVVSQTGDTYTSSSAVTAGTIYVATNLKNYYKSDEVTPNTYTPTFNSTDKTATGTKEYKVTGATKYFVGDIVDKNENGYWDTDRSELVRGLTTTGWTTSNTISNVVHTYKVGTKQQAVVVPAKYTSVSGKDANQGDVAFNLVKTFDFTNAQGYISSYKVFVAPADDGLGSDSKITITIQK
jgi:tetrahydromethanopterin S-methyltransferase subunit G